MSREALVARWVDPAVPWNSDRVNRSSNSQADSELGGMAESAESAELGSVTPPRRRTCTRLECNVRVWQPESVTERTTIFLSV